MLFMAWSDSLSVGIRQIDEQHKHLIDLINNLYDAMSHGQGKAVLERTLDELANYTVEHFSVEEVLMRKHSYSGYPTHKAEHESFVQKVVDFKQGFADGKALLSIDIMNFLRDWTVNHIAETDKKFGPFFNSKGIV
ncbi:MAG: hemerythrin [Spirochaetes bacterium GWF1_51_8]|nr:MAG: hemerythrin [Spirochaetes bacterium GWF1_51_8]